MIRVSLCQRNKSRGILTWYVRIFDTETKDIRYESLGSTKKTAAHDLMLQKQADGDFEKKKSDSMTLGRAFELYERSLELRGASDKTLQVVHNSLDKMRELFGRPVSSIKKGEVVAVFDRATETVKPSSYNTMKTYVKTAFKYAETVLEASPRNPADALRSRKVPQKERDFWTPEQIDLILDKARSGSMRLLWAFMAFAGLRVHEAVKVKKEDIRDGFLYVVGKGNKPAKIPVSSRLRAEIERYRGGWIFPSASHSFNSLKVAAKEALGEDMTGKPSNHRLRHSFASNALRAGIGIDVVRRLLRHSNITTTMNIYAHLLDEDLVIDIEKMFKNP